MKVGFDLISDLNLEPDEKLNWEGKATSLYCIVAGNISHDIKTIIQTLTHLGHFYQGVFYTLGSLEYRDFDDLNTRTVDLLRHCRHIKNVSVLHHHVVIVDGVAVLGCNGWYGNKESDSLIGQARIHGYRLEDIVYLKNSIEKLQKHLDVKKIVLASNSVPHPDLFFGERHEFVNPNFSPSMALVTDTQKKISTWVFGSYSKIVDTQMNGIHYLNNPCVKSSPYWAKRFEIEI